MRLMQKVRNLYLMIICTGIILLSNSFLISGSEASPSWIHPDNNSTECINCHNIDKIELPLPNSNEYMNSKESPISQNGGTGSKVSVSNNILYVGGTDCVSCHDILGTGSEKHIDASAIKQGVHGNLNNATDNSTVLSDLVNKACWACHGNGTEPAGDHPSNYATPYSCADCHNRTANLSFTNFSIISSITTSKVFEHIQPPYFENISSTMNNSNANCEGCHDKSKVGYSDSGFSRMANVSHYASRTNLVNPSINCSLCHKNSQNASQYWANITRHPARSQDDSFCDNCHNITPAKDLHSQQLVKPYNIHSLFDWQNDDSNEITPFGENEGCMSCHSGGHATGYSLCEDCHTGDGPSSLEWSRSDISDVTPRVSAHTNFSTVVNVPDQSQIYPPSPGTKTFSSCYSFNNITLEGTCHGNSWKNSSASGGFYAFKRIYYDIRSTPYHFTRTIDRLPDTTNCVFCHNQTDAVIRKAWGNATQISSERHSWYTGVNNSKCWSCHVNTGYAPKDFHSENVTGGGGSDCISCHSPNDVNILKFARHANLNISDGGQDNVTNSDCWTCHYQKDMDRNHVYLCESCHSNSSGIVTVGSSLIKADFMHGITSCKTCHAPKGYHGKGTVGPLGIVENILKKNI